MSKFPLIGKNVLVIYGNQKDHYRKLSIASGILVSINALTNEKKEAKPKAKAQAKPKATKKTPAKPAKKAVKARSTSSGQAKK
jgi:hypothetical protein